MLVADIGNTHIHIYNGRDVEHLSPSKAIKLYAKKRLRYISVNHKLEAELQKKTNWKNISSLINLKGSYESMGVDRRALCLACSDGILVDAGSAITVDIMERGVYQGGFILAGVSSILKAYGDISPILDIELNRDIPIDILPKSTKDGVSYGVVAPIVSIIQRYQNGKKIYFTGGDGKYLSQFFDGAIFDETLIFRGICRQVGSR
jgi:type III pantothenate kinase